MHLRHPRRLLLAAAAAVALLAGCSPTGEEIGHVSDLPSTPPASPTSSPSPSPTPSVAPEDDREEESQVDGVDADRDVAGNCAAYRDSGSWCADGVGDYDCEGGSGNGPNYAPRGVRLVEPGADPFKLDRDGDGEGCESQPAPPPPPEPEPEPEPVPETDPRFGTCGEATASGYGPYYRGQDPEYDWYRDADGDGVVCE